MSRKKALKLPLWEFQSLLEEYYRIDAHRALNQLHCVAAGFNGGEGLEKLEQALRERIEPKATEIELTEDVTLEALFGGFNIPTLE